MSHIENHISRRHASPRPSPPSPLTRASPLSSSSSSASSDVVDDLPYPLPLPRSPFTVPPSSFSAPAYLSTLSQRHQTLSDLRSDLRARSQLIARELLDLVNGNYVDFLSLGQALQGGEERVEEVRVGVLGLRGALGEVKGVVADREDEVRGLVEERERVRGGARVARALLEVECRMAECEDALGVAQEVGMGGAAAAAAAAWGKKKKKNRVKMGDEGKASSDDDDDDDSDDDDDEEDYEDEDDDDDDDEQQDIPGAVSLPRLRRLVRQYLSIRQLAEHIGAEHPFLAAQEPRLIKIRNTLLLDLGAALKHAKAAGAAGQPRVLKIMSIYAEMDEGAEAVKVLKGERSG
ncbi:oligomeric golgi complex component, COG2-domain-containing protein [Phyllosticta citriasiana]|uniref:oligomeric golgi complex component, COG2-domain-containing protein n=1 Tax=Phyllosticta citriasiana TaxID=595635 RepID=UPI0030FD970F